MLSTVGAQKAQLLGKSFEKSGKNFKMIAKSK